MPLLYGRIIHYEKRKNQKEKNLFLVFWSECRDSLNCSVVPVEPGTNKCPLDTCICFSNLTLKRKNQKEKNLFLVFLVRVSRFELEAS